MLKRNQKGVKVEQFGVSSTYLKWERKAETLTNRARSRFKTLEKHLAEAYTAHPNLEADLSCDFQNVTHRHRRAIMY